MVGNHKPWGAERRVWTDQFPSEKANTLCGTQNDKFGGAAFERSGRIRHQSMKGSLCLRRATLWRRGRGGNRDKSSNLHWSSTLENGKFGVEPTCSVDSYSLLFGWRFAIKYRCPYFRVSYTCKLQSQMAFSVVSRWQPCYWLVRRHTDCSAIRNSSRWEGTFLVRNRWNFDIWYLF